MESDHSGEIRKSYPTAAEDLTGWRSLAIQELARLNGEQWARKKKDTIIALVDAHLAGHSEETVWDRPETCNRSTWHGKWKKEPLIADVLAQVDAIADGWRDNRKVEALAEAAQMLMLESPASVRAAVELRDTSGEDRVRLQAAFGILDRAGVETATKSSSTTKHELSDDVETALNRIYGDDSDSDGDETETE